MKAAFYIGTRSGWRGIGNVLVRWRLRSQISHCELVFEPGDGVDDLMPRDGQTMLPTTQPVAGEYWCASSSATDPMPTWSPRRAGHRGGVRFKRIDVRDSSKWLLVDVPWADARAAALWFREHQGALYDWQGIVGFIAWPVPDKTDRWSCHEACAAALGHPAPSRTDPAALCETLLWRTS